MAKRFDQFNAKIVPGLNDMLARLTKLENMRGDSFINLQRTAAGTTIGLNLTEARKRIAKGGGAGGSASTTEIKIATCSEDAPAGDEISAVLNSSQEPLGEPITVKCLILNGSDLNEATPRLEINGDILVANIRHWDWTVWTIGDPKPSFTDQWYCLTNFQTTEDCTCGT